MSERDLSSPVPDVEEFLPLSPIAFHILLALVGRELHGYGIMQEVESRTNGKLRIGAGTMYGALKRMLKEALVEEKVDQTDRESERRRHYRLTSLGGAVVRADAKRIEQLVGYACDKRLLPRHA